MNSQRINGQCIIPAVSYLQHQGVQVEEQLSQLGITVKPDALDERVYIPHDTFMRLLDEVYHSSSFSESFHHYLRTMHGGQFGLIGYAMASSATLQDALILCQKTATLLHMVCGAMRREVHAGEVHFIVSLGQQETQACYIAAYLIRLLEICVGKPAGPSPLTIVLPEAVLSDLAGSILTLRQGRASECRIEIRSERHNFALPGANKRVFALFDRELAIECARQERQTTLTGRLRDFLLNQPEFHRLSAGEAAKQFAMSERSFARRLAEEDASFRQILAEVRSLKSLSLLLAGNSVDVVAETLGFSERTSFERAFKKWQGVTPSFLQSKYAALSKETPVTELIDLNRIPGLPRTASALLTALDDKNGNMDALADIVNQDAVLAARILQVANSSLYGRLNIATVKQAITTVFGVDKLRAIAVSLLAVRVFPLKETEFDFAHFHHRALIVAKMVEILAESCNRPRNEVADLYFAGLLHNIGELFIAFCRPNDYQALRLEREGLGSWHAYMNLQQMRLGIDAMQCSVFLTAFWSLPGTITALLKSADHEEDKNVQASLLNASVSLADHLGKPANEKEVRRTISALLSIPALRMNKRGNADFIDNICTKIIHLLDEKYAV